MDLSTVIASFVSAIIGSVVGPVVKVRLDVFSSRRNGKARKIELWKRSVVSLKNPQPSKIKSMPHYREFRGHLPDGLRDAIENAKTDRDFEHNKTLRLKILDALSELEKKWGLL